jgi:hypothetical protein
MKTMKKAAGHLPKWQKRYAELKQELQGLGFVCVGSLQTRYLECGKASCHCHDDPANRHGPYHYWTRKIQGRTVSVLLHQPEVEFYRERIQNNRHLDRLVREMRQVSARALTLEIGRKRQKRP